MKPFNAEEMRSRGEEMLAEGLQYRLEKGQREVPEKVWMRTFEELSKEIQNDILKDAKDSGDITEDGKQWAKPDSFQRFAEEVLERTFEAQSWEGDPVKLEDISEVANQAMDSLINDLEKIKDNPSMDLTEQTREETKRGPSDKQELSDEKEEKKEEKQGEILRAQAQAGDHGALVKLKQLETQQRRKDPERGRHGQGKGQGR